MDHVTGAAPDPLEPELAPAPRPSRAHARPVRVAMITSMFPPSVGGIQMHTLLLARKLVDLGAEVHVVTRAERGLDPFERMRGVRVHRAGASRAHGAAASLAFIADAARQIMSLRHHFDVLHAHQLLSPTTVALLAARTTGLPMVLNPHACGSFGDVGVLSASRVGRLRLRAAVERADAFVAVSRAIRDELLAAGAPPQRIWSIANGVDTDRFSPCPPPSRALLRAALELPEGPLVVYSGRLSPEKGVDVLLDAWPGVLRRVAAARLWIVGGGPEERSLRERAHALGVAETIAFAGAVQDVSPYVRAADAAVLPSRTEGMPVSLLEAMSCATPVVATRVGGSAEVLDDGVTGRLVPPSMPDALAAAIAELLVDRATAQRQGAAARAHVLAHYSIDAIAERFLALYGALAARRSGAPALGGRGRR